MEKISPLYHVLCNLFGSNMIYLWMHMNFFMKCMSYFWNKFLMEFSLFMQVNFVKELETSFWDFVHKWFEEMIFWNLFYRTDIYSPFHYIFSIFMVQYPWNGLIHFSFMLLPFIWKLVLWSDCLAYFWRLSTWSVCKNF